MMESPTAMAAKEVSEVKRIVAAKEVAAKAAGGYKDVSEAAAPAKGFLLDFAEFTVQETFPVNLNANACSPAALQADWESGIVNNVADKSPLQLQGIIAGMRIVTLDAQPYSSRLMHRKVALGKDFAAVFATGVSVDHPVDRLEEGFIVKNFSGEDIPMGVSCDRNTGRISNVDVGSQAADQGIEVGMVVRMIDKQPYEGHKLAAPNSFEAVLLKIPKIQGRDAAQLISRSSRSLPDGPVWHQAADFSWMEDWSPGNRVPAYLDRFGFEAEDSDKWHRCPSDGAVKLGIKVERHEERPTSKVSEGLGGFGKLLQKATNFGHTWYVIECTISKGNGLDITSWLAPRRLGHIQKYLELRVQQSLGNRYEYLFEDVETPIPGGGKPGTTKIVHKWFSTLADHINNGVVSPALCALLLSFLMAPVTSDAREVPTPDLFLAEPAPDSEVAVAEEASSSIGPPQSS